MPGRLVTLALAALAASASAQVDFKARDAALSRGTISFHQSDPDKTQRDISLTYSGDGRVVQRIDTPSKRAPNRTTEMTVGGHGWYYDQHVGPKIDAVEFGPSMMVASSLLESIPPKPSVPLVGGLSALANIKSSVAGPLVVTGAFPDSSILKITYGVNQSKGVPDLIEQTGKHGKLLHIWRMSGVISAGGGLYLPQHIDIINGKGNRITSFTIQSADFSSEPKDSDLITDWFHPGATFQDRAIPQVVEWNYDDLLAANHGNKVLTPEQFHLLSSEKYQHSPHNDFRFSQPESFGLTYVKFLFSLLILCALAVVLFVVLKRKPSA